MGNQKQLVWIFIRKSTIQRDCRLKAEISVGGWKYNA